MLARVCLVEAADGHRAAFALPELDPAYGEARVLLADTKDGKRLAPEEGPFKVVFPSERCTRGGCGE